MDPGVYTTERAKLKPKASMRKLYTNTFKTEVVKELLKEEKIMA